MLLRERVAALQAHIASTPFVTATSLSYEERPPSAGLIRGTIEFVDGSRLELKEFLITSPSFRLIKYGYHYGTGRRLIFRYDNANDPAARNLSSFPHHKHVSSGLLPSDEPTVEQILEEIVSKLTVP